MGQDKIKSSQGGVKLLGNTLKRQPTSWSWTLVLLIAMAQKVGMYRFQFIHATKSGGTK